MSRDNPSVPSPHWPRTCYTVGIESGFVVKAKPSFWHGTNANIQEGCPDYLCQQLIQMLRAHGVRVNDYNTYKEDRRTKWTLRHEPRIPPLVRDDPNDSQPGPRILTTILLESPVLSAGMDLFPEIRYTFEFLKTLRREDFELLVGEMCRLRINVGITKTDDLLYRQSIGFSSFAVHSIVQVTLSCSRTFSDIRPSSGLFWTENRLVPAVQLVAEELESPPLKFLRASETYESWERGGCMKPDADGAFISSIRHLVRFPFHPAGKPPADTIEFGQRATLEYEDVFYWIWLRLTVVHLCDTQTQKVSPRYLRWCKESDFNPLQGNPESIVYLIDVLGAPDQTVFYHFRGAGNGWRQLRPSSF